jgi:UPF0042 nucleotide-binding protein
MNEPEPTFPTGIPLRDSLGPRHVRGEVLVITGLSGAGRTQAAAVLEDLGWYVVDNLPPQMIPPLAGMMTPTGHGVQRLAVVVDVRSRQFFDTLIASLERLTFNGLTYRIVFLDASDETLVRRYEHVRRPHPLQGDGTILTGIGRERELLGALREQADEYVDTSLLSVHELAARMTALADPEKANELRVAVTSFGYKHGVPVDANNVLDVRFLANPYWVDELRHLTGLDPAVHKYVLDKPEAKEFVDRYVDALRIALASYAAQNKHFVSVAVGCTGGRHRSVAVAEAIAAALRADGIAARITHRDLGRE